MREIREIGWEERVDEGMKKEVVMKGEFMPVSCCLVVLVSSP